MSAVETDVAVLGAGPAGLAAAYCLGRRNIRHRVFEEGPRPLAGLRKVDPDMVLRSPKPVSLLPGMRFEKGVPAYPTMAQLIRALDDYSDRHGIEVECGSTVRSVERTNGVFEVRFNGDRPALRSRFIVNSTGVVSQPTVPEEFNPEECSIPWKHSRDVREDDLASSTRLLVVGCAISGGEVLDSWLRQKSPQDRCWLSCRSRLLTMPRAFLGIDVHYWVWLPEQCPSYLAGWRAARLHEPMMVSRVARAIHRDRIHRVGRVDRYQGETAVLESGERLNPDLIVFATGYRYATSHLNGLLDYDPDGRPRVCCCESTRTNGLFFLGYKFGRTFASPYLRGIGRDARYVAKKISRSFSAASAAEERVE